MTFQVHWLQVAINGLSSAWLEADQVRRRAITEAANRIEKALEDRPNDIGESRSGGRRIYIDQPLGVLFKVNVRLKIVLITQVWLIQDR